MAAQTSPSLNQSELARLSQSTSQIGNQELLLAAMFGKMVQGGLNNIKKQSAEVGGNLKVSDVDMSKVMPSHILPAMGIKQPQQQQRPPNTRPVPQQVQQPEPQMVYTQPKITEAQIASIVQNIPPVTDNPTQSTTKPVGVPEEPYSDPNQLEFDLNKQTQLEDIINAVDKLQNSVNILTDKVNTLIDNSNKKKPKITNGTQAG